VFLNHGSFGACPKPILDLQTALRRQMEAEPVQFLWRRYEERLEPARQTLARFVGSPARDLTFVTNTTTGINAVLRSLALRPGDALLTTSLDYNACHNVLVEVTRRARARLIVVRLPFPVRGPDDIVSAVLRALTARTQLAMLDHVTSDSALVLPIARLVRELEARGVPTLVDGAHAPGMVPLNLARLRPAYYTGNLHKWVCAPKGAAFLWAREDLQDDLQPTIISHGNNRRRSGFTPFQDRFDWPGTFDPTAWMCVGEAIRWMGSLLPGGWPEVRARNHALAVQARTLLCARWNVEAPCPPTMLGSMAAVPLPARLQARPPNGKIDADQLRLYDEVGLEVPFSRFGSPPVRYLRVSAQLYNTIHQYHRLARAVETL
jgi:isopenicillin-N epimerase